MSVIFRSCLAGAAVINYAITPFDYWVWYNHETFQRDTGLLLMMSIMLANFSGFLILSSVGNRTDYKNESACKLGLASVCATFLLSDLNPFSKATTAVALYILTGLVNGIIIQTSALLPDKTIDPFRVRNLFTLLGAFAFKFILAFRIHRVGIHKGTSPLNTDFIYVAGHIGLLNLSEQLRRFTNSVTFPPIYIGACSQNGIRIKRGRRKENQAEQFSYKDKSLWLSVLTIQGLITVLARNYQIPGGPIAMVMWSIYALAVRRWEMSQPSPVVIGVISECLVQIIYHTTRWWNWPQLQPIVVLAATWVICGYYNTWEAWLPPINSNLIVALFSLSLFAAYAYNTYMTVASSG